MAILYIVATPIGNLEDFSRRAVETLKGVDLILCEDTRVTKKLLDHYQIQKPLSSYHQHSKLKNIENIIQMLQNGKNLALVSDAGTPGISDPGNMLIKEAFKMMGDKLKAVAIPGPSALATAASVSGMPMERFIFLGFPPVKKKRKKFFEETVRSDYPVIFYESPYRIIKTLGELEETAKKNSLNPALVVCRELTKKFETVFRGSISQVLFEIQKQPVKGEFVVICEGKKQQGRAPQSE